MSERQLFHDWIKDHARGTLNDEMTAALGEVVEAVTHLEKKGEIVLKFVIEPASAGGRTVVVAGEVTSKPPKPAPEVSIFFAGDNGSLHRSDPYQQRIDTTTGEIMEIGE